ncbi:MAG: phenylacetate--CoA ligase family protein [Terriglobia bacterium]
MNSSTLPDRSSIEGEQLSKLRVLFSELIPGNPFYSGKLQSPSHPPLEISTLDNFRKTVPFTTKQELIEDQRQNPPYGSNLTYPLERYTRLSQTSATRGTPMKWLDTPESWQWMLESWEKIYRVSGITARDRLFFAFSFAPFLGFWTAFEAAARLGCLSIPGGGLSSAARLRLILDHEMTVLLCTPTYALRLAEVAGKERLDLSVGKIRRIIVAGEPGGSLPGVRKRIEAHWPGAVVVDHHGMTETGPVSYACPARRDVLHIIESAYIAEVIAPDSAEKPAYGKRGELVLTSLGRTGSPLLRYRTGDLVETAPELVCPCGSSELALLGGILGRVDDMMIVRGVNLHPSAVEEVLHGFPGIEEFRVEVQSSLALTEATIHIETASQVRNPEELARQIENALHTAFALRIPVKPVPHGSLPRSEMKANRWVRT